MIEALVMTAGIAIGWKLCEAWQKHITDKLDKEWLPTPISLDRGQGPTTYFGIDEKGERVVLSALGGQPVEQIEQLVGVTGNTSGISRANYSATSKDFAALQRENREVQKESLSD